MAVVGRIGSISLLKRGSPSLFLQVSHFTCEAKNPNPWTKKKISLYAALGITLGGTCVFGYLVDQSVKAYDWPCHPPKYPWSHNGLIDAYDHASIRRGFYVYKNVCSACHSIDFLPFRRLIDVAFTEDEMREIAAEYQIHDGPDEKGEMFVRPGKISDYIPAPYPNEDAAAAANNGAVPPDLSLIVLAREGNEDYIFSLLNGYVDEIPAGVEVSDGAYYNPYFLGSVIAMAPPLYNNVFEYEDGTPATKSQLAKDVITFLAWCSQPEMEKRKSWLIKVNLYGALFLIVMGYVNRHKWTSLRSRTIMYNELRKAK